MDDRLVQIVPGGDAVGMIVRPALRPGAPLLRRSATHLQVGTSPGIVIADRPGLVALLRLLDGVRDVERLQEMASADIPELDDTVATVLTELRAVGAVVDATTTDGHRHRHRSSVSLGVDAGAGTTELVVAARSALSAAGVAHLSSPEPDLLVIASFGEAARSVYERASLLGVDHLPVVIDEDRVRIGPFVRPGRTPCVGCHDLHRADWDPAWPALLHQLGRPPLTRPPAIDPLTLRVAAIELAVEVLSHIDGRVPRSVGRCLVIGPDHDERAMWPVAFHHRCACDLLNAA